RQSPFQLCWALRLLFDNCKLNFLFYRIDPINQNPNALPQTICFSGALADDFAGVLVIGVAIVSEAGERHQAFNKEIRQFDEEAEFRDTDDESVEIFANAILHEFDFLPFHQLAFGSVGATFGLAGLFGYIVKLFDGDWTSKRFGGSVLSSL